MKSPLRYPGGKSRAVPLILPYIPEGRVMVSPFIGGGSIELALAARGQEVFAFDAWKPLVNFWQHILAEHEAVCHEAPRWCPMDRDLYFRQRSISFGDGAAEAARFYGLNRASFTGVFTQSGYSGTRSTHSAVDALRAFRPPANLHVVEADFRLSIRFASRHGYTIYADPPYITDRQNLYGDKGKMHMNFDHEGLAEALRQHVDGGRAGFLLSYNDHPTIRGLYEDWCEFIPMQWAYGMSKDSKSNEVLIRPKGQGPTPPQQEALLA